MLLDGSDIVMTYFVLTLRSKHITSSVSQAEMSSRASLRDSILDIALARACCHKKKKNFTRVCSPPSGICISFLRPSCPMTSPSFLPSPVYSVSRVSTTSLVRIRSYSAIRRFPVVHLLHCASGPLLTI